MWRVLIEHEKGGGECVDTEGSFECICPDGTHLAEDGRTCIDDNECDLMENPCINGRCVNLILGMSILPKINFKCLFCLIIIIDYRLSWQTELHKWSLYLKKLWTSSYINIFFLCDFNDLVVLIYTRKLLIWIDLHHQNVHPPSLIRWDEIK